MWSAIDSWEVLQVVVVVHAVAVETTLVSFADYSSCHWNVLVLVGAK